MGDDGAGDERAAGVAAVESGDAIGEFGFIGEGVVDEDGHTDVGFVDGVAEAFEEGVDVVEAGVDALDGAEDTAFIGFSGVAGTGAGCVVVEVIEEAATVTVVETGAGERVGVFDIGGATEADLPVGIEGVEQGEDVLLLLRAELGGGGDECADFGQGGLEFRHVWGVVGEGGESGGDFVAQALAGRREGLIEEGIPEVEGESDGGRG